MRLNHLNLTVPDVPRTREFFETYFGFRCVAEMGRDALAVLVDESEFVLTLNNFGKATEFDNTPSRSTSVSCRKVVSGSTRCTSD